jgi:hypothetical protein
VIWEDGVPLYGDEDAVDALQSRVSPFVAAHIQPSVEVNFLQGGDVEETIELSHLPPV